ncbi:MAG: carbon-phosphorus lyase complex subunit PhnI [Roseovarius sp.]|nr:carbon-phosphorus lyase complex subunit PhnI [Roseovarius sp.]
MGYTVVRGGTRAMLAAEEMLDAVRLGAFRAAPEAAPEVALQVEMILSAQRHAVDRVMCEAGLYAPRLAALAIVQSEGDVIHASFVLRALRVSLPRRGTAEPLDMDRMRVLRRLSSAFKSVPGGQFLGPTRDYTLHFLRHDLLREVPQARLAEALAALGADDAGETAPLPAMPRVVEVLREAGLVKQPAEAPAAEPADITMAPMRFPRPARSARLQALARGESGMLIGLAYSSLRGYGHSHPTLGELRVGHVPVRLRHPLWDIDVEIGEVPVTQVDAIIAGVGTISTSGDDEDGLRLALGFGAALGQQEERAIAMSILDGCLEEGDAEEGGPSDDTEFVLYHCDGVESLGFVEHLKKPHYMLFASVMDRMSAANATGRDAVGDTVATPETEPMEAGE